MCSNLTYIFLSFYPATFSIYSLNQWQESRTSSWNPAIETLLQAGTIQFYIVSIVLIFVSGQRRFYSSGPNRSGPLINFWKFSHQPVPICNARLIIFLKFGATKAHFNEFGKILVWEIRGRPAKQLSCKNPKKTFFAYLLKKVPVFDRCGSNYSCKSRRTCRCQPNRSCEPHRTCRCDTHGRYIIVQLRIQYENFSSCHLWAIDL